MKTSEYEALLATTEGLDRGLIAERRKAAILAEAARNLESLQKLSAGEEPPAPEDDSGVSIHQVSARQESR